MDKFDKAMLEALAADREVPTRKPPKWLWRGLWLMYTLAWAVTIAVAGYIGYLFYK